MQHDNRKPSSAVFLWLHNPKGWIVGNPSLTGSGKSSPSLGNDCQEKRGVLATGLDSSLIATIVDRSTCGTGVGMSSTTIHWGRILLGGLLAEVALILAIVPLGLRLGDNFLHYTAPPDPSSCASWSALGVSADRIPFHSAWDVGGSGRGTDLRCLDARAA
jgi:hypothetical protein